MAKDTVVMVGVVEETTVAVEKALVGVTAAIDAAGGCGQHGSHGQGNLPSCRRR